MKKFFRILILILLTLQISGCATIISKSNYPVLITSQPEGADIKITNEKGVIVSTGRTPTTINLAAGAGFFQGQNYTVTFTKEGYSEHKLQISRGIDAWYIVGNFFIGLNKPKFPTKLFTQEKEAVIWLKKMKGTITNT